MRTTYILVGMSSPRNPERTKEKLLNTAAKVIHKSGFGAASLGDILDETGLTKGALYHHFPNKKALGLAVVASIRQLVSDFWLKPLEGTSDPIAALEGILTGVMEQMASEDIILGCPLNNLAQEMSAVDEDFRRQIGATYRLWCDGFAAAFERGIKAGTVARDVDPAATAAFIVASLTGGRGLAKTTRDATLLHNCGTSLLRFIESLRPPAS